MTADEQKRYVNYLVERVREADLGLRARDLVLQDFLDKQKEYESRLSKMDEILSRIDCLESELKEKDHKLKSSERKIADLTAKLKFANKNRFGNKSHSTKNEKYQRQEESDRSQDKDNFDGTSSSLPDKSVAKGAADNSAKGKDAQKQKRDTSNRPETYSTMGVQGTAKEYKSDLSKVPGRILDRRMVPVFHLEMNNSIAERTIRPLTTQRNSMLHFGSDEVAEMAATYHSIISTVKMHGRSAWEFLGKFFTKIFNGCRDYYSLQPNNIGLAICQ